MTNGKKVTRRDFVRTVVGGAAAATLVSAGAGSIEAIARTISPGTDMPVRPLGKTGHQVKIFSLGGQATLEEGGRDGEADAIINKAIDLGVNYIDTARVYGKGVSETYIGKVMKTRRNEVFLASKTRCAGWASTRNIG